MNYWTETKNAAQLVEHFAKIAQIDPRFARSQQEFYATRTANELKALRAGAWDCSEKESYMLAQSYLALKVS